MTDVKYLCPQCGTKQIKLEQQIKELEENEDDYWNGYSDGFNSSQDLSIEYFENKN